MIDLDELSPEELPVLIAEAKRRLYPEAMIVGDELECSQCHERTIPALIEDGMTVTHDLQTLSTEKIEARGWDGNSSAVSEEGERLLLECRHCFQWHRLPEDNRPRMVVRLGKGCGPGSRIMSSQSRSFSTSLSGSVWTETV